MFLFLFSAILSVVLLHQLWYRRRNLPPGPTAWPLVGNILSLWKVERWEDKFLEWKQQYGNIFTIWMGPIPFITVNDYKTAVEMFIKDGDAYADRFSPEAFSQLVRGGRYGIADSNGDLWREQRRFALRVLRDFGLGKNRMEERILEEVELINQKVDTEIDSGVVEHDLQRHTDIAIGSVINVLVNGYRFSDDSKNEAKFYKLKELTEKMNKAAADPFVNMGMNSEFLAQLPIINGRFQNLVDVAEKITEFVQEAINDHHLKNDYDEEFEPDDLIDAYLLEKNRADKKGQNHYFSDIQLRNVVLDLWLVFAYISPYCYGLAGQETTTSTMTWALAYLIRNPEIQQKLQNELDKIVGKDRLVVTADRAQLPFTNAVVMEVQRTANIIGINLPRTTTRDVEICGFTVPKGTACLAQISALHYDPEVFPNPHEFNPSRFIDENGKLKQAEELLPFSLGKRACPGEGLARMELFLFIANLAKRYQFTSGKAQPTLLKAESGMSMGTKPFKCRIRRRES